MDSMKQKSLLVLPCNTGAKIGNYFGSNNGNNLWMKIDKCLRDIDIRDRVDIAAVDCILPLVKNINIAIIGEWEMNLVKGYDIYPATAFAKKDRNVKLEKLINGIVDKLRELILHYSKIVFLINVIPYKLAVINAIERLKLWNKVTIIDWLICGFAIPKFVIEKTLDTLINTEVGIIYIPDSQIYNWNGLFGRKEGFINYQKSIMKFQSKFWNRFQLMSLND